MADEGVVKEEDVFKRPPSTVIQNEWRATFSDPLISLSRLRAKALSKDGIGGASASASEEGVVLRSVYWRFYHNLLPPPTSLDLFAPSLETSRSTYDSLRRRYLVAPDGRWAADCSGYDEYKSNNHASSSSGSGTTDEWDPLSLSGSNPWKLWFTHVDLRSTIRQDVERTFPDQPYFQIERVRRSLTTCLFLYSVLNPDVGYRQGMHELLACCFLAVDQDSLENSAGEGYGDEAMRNTLDRKFVEHDSFELFNSLMKNAKSFYEWRAEEGSPRNHKLSTSTPQAPIIVRCNHLHTSLIRRIDPQLWEHLENEGVEAQIWAIRWLRLLFTRELPFHLAMRLWDGIFAQDPNLGILDFVAVAMLLLIRNELINADYPSLLTKLLHYPSPSPSYPFEPFLILSQALFLRNSISPASGVEVVIQNQELLGVKVSPPESEQERDEPLRRPLSRTARGGATISRSRTPKGVGGLAQGLFERAQAAGLDKAFMSTVADLRKNLPDSTTAYSYLPNLPFSPLGSPGYRDSSGPFSTIPNNTSVLPSRLSYYPTSPPAFVPVPGPSTESRPSIDSQISEKTVKDAEREMAELRLAMVGMGKAMNDWLEIIKTKQESGDDAAWKGLERIRETLLDAAGKEVEDIVREWAWHDGLETSSRSTTPAPEVEVDSSNIPSSSQVEWEVLSAPSTPGAGPRLPGDMPLDPLAEDRTPTAPQVDILPDTPIGVYPSSGPVSGGNTNTIAPNSAPLNTTIIGSKSGANTPVLRLSSRDDRPSTFLTRTIPMSAPPPQTTFPRSTFDSPRNQVLASTEQTDVGTDADPLAGLGVSVRREVGSSKKNASGRVDPLLGLGVR